MRGLSFDLLQLMGDYLHAPRRLEFVIMFRGGYELILTPMTDKGLLASNPQLGDYPFTMVDHPFTLRRGWELIRTTHI